MITITPLLLFVIISLGTLLNTLTFYLGRRIGQQIGADKNSKTIEDVINEVKIPTDLNPLVRDIYLQFIDKEQIKYFQEDYYNVNIKNIDVSIWSANTVHARSFTKIPPEILKKYGKTFNEINDTLSLADKKILDAIVNVIKRDNKEFISRLFI